MNPTEEDEEIRFSSMEEALESIRSGGFVVVLDDEERENEGDLICAASLVTPEMVTLLVRHTTGIVCTPMLAEHAARLGLRRMVQPGENSDPHQTAFTVTCDHKDTSTGVSSRDRCLSIRALGSAHTSADELTRPGHIFPLIAREGGVLERQGHTEAAVDLCRWAQVTPPVGCIGELVDSRTGCMFRLRDCYRFATRHRFPIITVQHMIRYRRNVLSSSLLSSSVAVTVASSSATSSPDIAAATPKSASATDMNEKEVQHHNAPASTSCIATSVQTDQKLEVSTSAVESPRLLSSCTIPIIREGRHLGVWTLSCFGVAENIHVVLTLGNVQDHSVGPVLTRIHSECFTGDVLGSARCDCRQQLSAALECIAAAGRGALFYVGGHEGRGIGLPAKIRAYLLQESDAEVDTYRANLLLGFPPDLRSYHEVRAVLQHMRLPSIVLLTNNPHKVTALSDMVHSVRPLVCEATEHSASYLEAKRAYELMTRSTSSAHVVHLLDQHRLHRSSSPAVPLCVSSSTAASISDACAVVDHDQNASRQLGAPRPTHLHEKTRTLFEKQASLAKTDTVHATRDTESHAVQSEQGAQSLKVSDSITNHNLRIHIVHTAWNGTEIDIILSQLVSALCDAGVQKHHIGTSSVPGVFELPLRAQQVARKEKRSATRTLAPSVRASQPQPDAEAASEPSMVDAVICLGVVRDDQNSRYATALMTSSLTGLQQAQLLCEVPMINGVVFAESLQAKQHEHRHPPDVSSSNLASDSLTDEPACQSARLRCFAHSLAQTALRTTSLHKQISVDTLVSGSPVRAPCAL